MSKILQFIRPETAFDPEILAMLGDVYDRACSRYCRAKSAAVCEVMADRIIIAARGGERDPEKLWQVAVRGI
jgi:hypothetical protein